MAEAWAGSNPFLGMQNPYLQKNIDANNADTVRAYNLQVKPNTESAMAASGSFGNSGLMQMQGEQQRQLADTLAKQTAATRGQDYTQQMGMYQWDQGFNRDLFNDSFNQNQQGLSNYMGLLAQGNQFNQQDIANQTQIQNTPLQYLSQFSNLANGAGGLGGTTTGTQQQTGNPLLGAIGGWGLGSDLSKYFGG